MIDSPIVATSALVGGSTATFELFDLSAQRTDRRTVGTSDMVLRMTIAHALTGEQKAYGGSTRSVLRCDANLPAGDGVNGPCSAYAQVIVSRPVNPVAMTQSHVKALIQTLINVLLAEIDGTQSADSQLDDAFVDRFLAGEP